MIKPEVKSSSNAVVLLLLVGFIYLCKAQWPWHFTIGSCHLRQHLMQTYDMAALMLLVFLQCSMRVKCFNFQPPFRRSLMVNFKFRHHSVIASGLNSFIFCKVQWSSNFMILGHYSSQSLTQIPQYVVKLLWAAILTCVRHSLERWPY